MPARAQDFYALKNVPHGQISEHLYFSKADGAVRRRFVYTPPGPTPTRPGGIPSSTSSTAAARGAGEGVAWHILALGKYNSYPEHMTHGQVIAAMRSFNRFYTRLLGVLDRHFLDSPYSLTEVRVLFEIYHDREISARRIKDFLQIDEGYCSRLIDGLVSQGLVRRTRTTEDRRRYVLALTARGRKAFLELNQRSEQAIGALISGLSAADTTRLASALCEVQALLERRHQS